MYSERETNRLLHLGKNLMSKPDVEYNLESLENLIEVLRFHEWKYYVQNKPLISDFEYDGLYKKLDSIEREHPDWIRVDSPTQRVGSDLQGDFESVKHNLPMLSLDNSYNSEDLLDFDKQVKKLTYKEESELIEYSVEPKFDGGSIALLYEGDKLVRAATRGNGISGDDITHNARAMRSIPLTAKFSDYGISKVELRGEVLIRKDVFEKLNEKRLSESKEAFGNPRNSAAGGLRLKNPEEIQKRGLEVFIYQMGFTDGAENPSQTISDHFGSIDLLHGLGFKVPVNDRKLCIGIEQVMKYVKHWEAKRDDYPYEIDGMVIKVNSYQLQEKSGSTSHHPRWAIAYKFKAKQATTKLIAVEYQVGKVGSITPVAKVEPVHLAGVTVSSVSLHNEDFITDKDLRIGDMVVVERAGDVIPYISKAITEQRTGEEKSVAFPKYCPINRVDKVKLVREEGESAWRCPVCTCGEQDRQRMIFHVSKNAMDIDGFGKAYVERFYELGWLRTIPDIYNLDYDKIANLEGFGVRSAEKLKAAVEKAKRNPNRRLLHSLSIHHLGRRSSKLLAQSVQHVLDFQKWKEEDYTEIHEIGPILAKNMCAYFMDPNNINMLKQLETYGVNLNQTEEDKPLAISENAPLAGKTILFTGSLQKFKRKEAQELAAKAGAKNISAVSSNLNILVAGEKAGSKLKKAQALGTVKILTEEEFSQIIES